MTVSRAIHVSANGRILFFFMAELYSSVYICHVFFIHSSLGGHLGCFLVPVIFKEIKKRKKGIIYMQLIHIIVQQKITQCCKATIL